MVSWGTALAMVDVGDPEQLYELHYEIASGAFGTVYCGTHTKTKVSAAVKICEPQEDEVGFYQAEHAPSEG